MKYIVFGIVILFLAIVNFLINSNNSFNKNINKKYSHYEEQLFEPAISISDLDNIEYMIVLDSIMAYDSLLNESKVEH